MSFDWFDVDVVIAVVATLTQATTGILGWRVTMSGVPTDQVRKRIYEWIFIGASAVGVIAAGLAAHRSTNLVGELHAKVHIDKFWFVAYPGGTPNNPAVGVGKYLTGDVMSTNRGALPVQHFRVACELTVTPVLGREAEDRLFDQLSVDQKDRLNQPDTTEVLQGDNKGFGCVTKDKIPIDQPTFDALTKSNNGTWSVVYVTILVRYTDKLGKDLTTENCWHVYVGLPDKPVDCFDHNS